MTAKSKAVRSIQDELKKELAGLKERVEPPSGFTISTKGKVFTLPNGESSDGPMSCVVLDWVTENTYFEGNYNPQDIKPPVCWALGRNVSELKPSDDATKKQGDACSGCKQNEWGSAGGGSKGKACKNKRRLLIVPVGANEDTQPWIIKVSPTAIKHFDKYVNTAADHGVHPAELVTEISFEAAEAFPSLRFKMLQKHDDLDTMWAIKERGQEILMQEPKPDDK